MTTLLPHADHAFIDDRKIVGYLLDAAHPVGGPKAAFFASFGFSIDKPEVLAERLREHVLQNDAVALPPTRHGTKYEVRGPLFCPDGRQPRVKSIWMIRTGETHPRLVTAVPD